MTPLASVIIYFHSSRLDNLHQTMRLLRARHREHYQIVFVCHDVCHDMSLLDYFAGSTIYNCREASYRKGKMCNIGISLADCEWCGILDSDRILPHGYLDETVRAAVEGHAYSLTHHVMLDKSYGDDEIEAGRVLFTPDPRVADGTPHRKNLFSGNTIISKQDFFRMGGMDEEYVGYGFCDNDACVRAEKAGIQSILLGGMELHLHHSPNVSLDGEIRNDLRGVTLATNAMRFSLKHNVPVDRQSEAIIRQQVPQLGRYPLGVQKGFRDLRSRCLQR